MEMSYSQIIGTIGKVASVAYLTTGSKISISHMNITDLAAPTNCKYDNTGVIVGQLASLIRISDSVLSNNDCSYVYSDRTPVEIESTTFTDGLRSPYVNMVGSALLIQDSVFTNATVDKFVDGRGVKCIGCTQISITDSHFENMSSQKGGALYIDKSNQGQIY